MNTALSYQASYTVQHVFFHWTSVIETSELHFNECHYVDPEIIFTQSAFFILLEWLHFPMFVFTATAKEERINPV
jgi:hypothetical protein